MQTTDSEGVNHRFRCMKLKGSLGINQKESGGMSYGCMSCIDLDEIVYPVQFCGS